MSVPVFHEFTHGFNTGPIPTSVTITRPAGTVLGSLLVALINVDGTDSDASLSGWAQQPGHVTMTSLDGIRVLTREAGGSEPASYTFAITNGLGRIDGYIARISGHISTSIEDAAGEVHGISGVHTFPALDPSQVDALALAFICVPLTRTFTSADTERFDQNDNALFTRDVTSLGSFQMSCTPSGNVEAVVWAGLVLGSPAPAPEAFRAALV